MQYVSILVALAIVGHGGLALKLPVNPEVAMSDSPIWRVTSLLEEMKQKIMQDGRFEQQSYDKFSCWCERTLQNKAGAISEEKNRHEELNQEINKLAGETSSDKSTINQLKNDIASNVEELNEATKARDNEFADYNSEKLQAEQCIGALEAAINVLNGAGTKKAGFLELHQAQLISAVAGVRDVMAKPALSKMVSDKDMEVLTTFLDKPDDFIASSRSDVFSGAQVDKNPFGDYAPKSTQIQGILKGLYEGFTSNTEANSAEEANKQKSYEELKETKLNERNMLQTRLDNLVVEKTDKSKNLAEDHSEFKEVDTQLRHDEKFFSDTKAQCAKEALAWSARTRLRHEELTGITEAINILGSPEARAIFANSTTSLLQVSASPKRTQKAVVFAHLTALAAKSTTNSEALSQYAQEIRKGHFTKIVHQIQNMMQTLKEEDASDIKHRDECLARRKQNKDETSDLNFELSNANDKIDHLKSEVVATKARIEQLKRDIKSNEMEMEQATSLREEEEADFKRSQAADAGAIKLLEMAEGSLSKFYDKNMIEKDVRHDLGFLQTDQENNKQNPRGQTLEEYRNEQYAQQEAAIDPEKAPELMYNNEKGDRQYKGRRGDTGAIVSIMAMIKEDVEADMKKAAKNNALSEKDYKNTMKELKEALDGLKKALTSQDEKIADLRGEQADVEEKADVLQDSLNNKADEKKAIEADCSWVETHFEQRREDRQAEMEGLQEAQDFLLGAAAHKIS